MGIRKKSVCVKKREEVDERWEARQILLEEIVGAFSPPTPLKGGRGRLSPTKTISKRICRAKHLESEFIDKQPTKIINPLKTKKYDFHQTNHHS